MARCAHTLHAGFAVVKRGRDKVTGEPVAIKVRAWRQADANAVSARLQCAPARPTHSRCCGINSQCT
jgi:hypothetical protein